MQSEDNEDNQDEDEEDKDDFDDRNPNLSGGNRVEMLLNELRSEVSDEDSIQRLHF